MGISLIKAELKDVETIYKIQIKSFMTLLERYQDFETSPGSESVEKVAARINQPFTDYYIIKSDGVAVGGVSIVKRDNNMY